MLIEFDGGWLLRPYLINGRIWQTITHIHPTVHEDSYSRQYISTSVYNTSRRCTECGESPPDALRGYVKLIEWSMNDDN